MAASSSSELVSSEWSEWEWNVEHQCYQRYCDRPDGLEVEYEPVQIERILEVPLPHIPHSRSTCVAAPESDTALEAPDQWYEVHGSWAFERGRVFQIIWSIHGEQKNIFPCGHEDKNSALAFNWYWPNNDRGEIVRLFLIIESRDGFSLCLPIASYGDRGTNRKVLPKHCAIIRKDEHDDFSDLGVKDSKKMLQPIFVDPAWSLDRWDAWLDYTKAYTIHHNVKVLFIGKAHRDSEYNLMTDYKRVSTYLERREEEKSKPSTKRGGKVTHQKRNNIAESYGPRNGAGYVQVTAEGGQVFRDYGGQYEGQ